MSWKATDKVKQIIISQWSNTTNASKTCIARRDRMVLIHCLICILNICQTAMVIMVSKTRADS